MAKDLLPDSFTVKSVFNIIANHIMETGKLPVVKKHLKDDKKKRGLFEVIEIALENGRVEGIEAFEKSVTIKTLEEFEFFLGLAKINLQSPRRKLAPINPPPSFPAGPI